MNTNIASFLLGAIMGIVVYNFVKSVPASQNKIVKVSHTIVKSIVKPTPKPKSSVYGSAAQEYIAVVFGDQSKQAYIIARKASGFDCSYSSVKDDSYGLFGISKSNFDKLTGDVNNCESNTDAAYAIYQAEGWQSFKQ